MKLAAPLASLWQAHPIMQTKEKPYSRMKKLPKSKNRMENKTKKQEIGGTHLNYAVAELQLAVKCR
jgi:hypothetical protein